MALLAFGGVVLLILAVYAVGFTAIVHGIRVAVAGRVQLLRNWTVQGPRARVLGLLCVLAGVGLILFTRTHPALDR
jgi:hypothetical protein